jgi:acetyl esterase/lipase
MAGEPAINQPADVFLPILRADPLDRLNRATVGEIRRQREVAAGNVISVLPLKEVRAYEQKLQKNGVPVVTHFEPRMVHGFLNFYNNGKLPDASAAVSPIVDQIAGEIKATFALYQ